MKIHLLYQRSFNRQQQDSSHRQHTSHRSKVKALSNCSFWDSQQQIWLALLEKGTVMVIKWLLEYWCKKGRHEVWQKATCVAFDLWLVLGSQTCDTKTSMFWLLRLESDLSEEIQYQQPSTDINQQETYRIHFVPYIVLYDYFEPCSGKRGFKKSLRYTIPSIT